MFLNIVMAFAFFLTPLITLMALNQDARDA
jgi:hypothetical protein